MHIAYAENDIINTGTKHCVVQYDYKNTCTVYV